ncbi:MAG: hypothetical protein NWF01_02610 [Candidatus Bathyarchaeota archaeon]|nr:hypothetical protein [Candidatus Bathyarchaeota archaeon]
MSNYCEICGKPNNEKAAFCESCGSPITKVTTSKSTQSTPFQELAFGYSSLASQEVENKDSFTLLDVTSLFNQENHRRILCVIVKGLAKVIDGRNLLSMLLSHVTWDKQNTNYKQCLTELKEHLDQQYPFAFSNAQEKEETGLLVSIIDNGVVTALCIDGPRLLLVKENETIQTFKGTKTDPYISISMAKGDYICLSNLDLPHVIGQKEIVAKVAKFNNPQVACDEIATLVNSKKSGLALSLAIAWSIV